ncbi:acyl-CoA thioesterase [Propioniciclava sp. MC1683]|uniref:acyl-CoA thioesterase n=1 Tax=Propioniciclava sp. MC1683 TaxID=2760309 RepID=UPI0016027364|nr:acyl-CoA thioesterase [Propioniciclava sp. MC1683]MBB1500803.1 acyl-CoA thioesterase [Propioniciclava sp. MC1683]
MNLYWRMLLLRLRWLRARRLSIWDTARTPFRVVPTDLDLLLHMNNGKYLTLMDLGRMDLMVRSGMWAKLSARGWFPVVAGQTITYRKSLRLGQRFDLYTRVLGFDDKWGYVEQTFCVGETVYAHAIIRSRFLKKTGGSVEHDELEELVGEFPGHLDVPDWLHDWTASTKIDTTTFDTAGAA